MVLSEGGHGSGMGGGGGLEGSKHPEAGSALREQGYYYSSLLVLYLYYLCVFAICIIISVNMRSTT